MDQPSEQQSAVSIEKVLPALADPMRRALLARAATQSVSASQLAKELTISRQAIAKHLQILHDAGLVQRKRQGKAVVYATVSGPIAATARWMLRTVERWDQPSD
ncbi:MAG: metalloregulator ArsR/SmtB family transcription factor [Pseudomonadota bacterium]